MSKWKLVPVEWPDTPCPYGSPAHYAQMVAAAPKPSADVIDAMVERAAMSLADCRLWSGAWSRANEVERNAWLFEARAAILAALEMTDEP